MFKDNSRKEYNIIFYMRDREKIHRRVWRKNWGGVLLMVIEIGDNMTLVLIASIFGVVYITKKFMDD